MAVSPITAQALHTKYKAGIRAFLRQLGDPTLRLNISQEVDPYFRRCALAVWQQGGGIDER